MKMRVILAMIVVLTSLTWSDQLFLRNRPFKGAMVQQGQAIWVELGALATALEAELKSAPDGGHYLVLKGQSLSEVPAVAAGKVAIGTSLLESQEIKGVTMISLDEGASPLGLLVKRNPSLKSIDVSLAQSPSPMSSQPAPAAEPAQAVKKPLPPRLINRAGSAVRVETQLVPGRINIVDFYADWCGPCRRLAPSLEGLVFNNPDFCLLKVDIAQWDSPVARQYDLHSIPHLKIFDPQGKLIAEGDAAKAYLSKYLK